MFACENADTDVAIAIIDTNALVILYILDVIFVWTDL